MSELNEPRALRIFLCHSSGDKAAVRKLYARLITDGYQPWLDEEDLLPGQRWQDEIPKAVKDSDVVVVCLSKTATTKEGYVQKEIKHALDAAEEKPGGTIFLIPIRLEECTVPDRLQRWQWVDLFQEKGYERLHRALDKRAGQLAVADLGFHKPTAIGHIPKSTSMSEPENASINHRVSFAPVRVLILHAFYGTVPAERLQGDLSEVPREVFVESHRITAPVVEWIIKSVVTAQRQVSVIVVTPDLFDAEWWPVINKTLEERASDAVVIAFLMSDDVALWRDTALSKCMVIPQHGKAISTLEDWESACSQIVAAVRFHASEIRLGKP